MSHGQLQRLFEQDSESSTSSQAQLAHWLNDESPWEARLGSAQTDPTHLIENSRPRIRQHRESRSRAEHPGNTATSMENNAGGTIHYHVPTPHEWRDLMGELKTLTGYEQTMLPSWATSMTMLEGMQTREDILEEEQPLAPSLEAQGLPSQNLAGAVFGNISRPAVPPSVIQQACIIARRSSCVLAEAQFQAFECQPLEVQRQSIRIFFENLASRGPEFGVTRRLSQEELNSNHMKIGIDDNEDTVAKTESNEGPGEAAKL